MNAIVPGHRYQLQNFEDPENGDLDVIVQFIHKEPKGGFSTELDTIQNGTTNEEVLRMLIDRLNYLQSKHSCRENAIVITKLEESLMWLEKRTNDRKARGVEGTNKK